uniref:Uncharacterized protein n=1 Tax=Cacopsylla melanoneura TaxID=428564 RepID=A0A8D8U0L2_9HEMI
MSQAIVNPLLLFPMYKFLLIFPSPQKLANLYTRIMIYPTGLDKENTCCTIKREASARNLKRITRKGCPSLIVIMIAGRKFYRVDQENLAIVTPLACTNPTTISPLTKTLEIILCYVVSPVYFGDLEVPTGKERKA